MGICGTLFLIFLLCKIFGVMPIAAWSWWLVCAPIIAEIVFDILIIIIWAICKR